MSNITDITNGLHTLVQAALPSYSRIPDAIDIIDNSETYMREGYAINIGASDPVTVTVKGLLDQNRTFAISLIHRVNQTQHNATGIEDAKLDILEDGQTLVKDLHLTNDTILGNAIDCSFVQDEGVFYLVTDRSKFYILTQFYTIRYRENLTI